MVNITQLSETQGVLKLLVKDIDVSVINGIRRTALNGVPIFSIDLVKVYTNTSVVFDEYLTQRLAMLPIQTDREIYKLGDTIKFTLDKQGPGTAYSSDLVCEDPKIEIANARVPLAKLKENQSIKLEATAVMSVGKEHVKFQPGIIAYTQLPKIKQRKELKKPEKVVQEHSKGLLEVKYNKVIAKNPYEWSSSDYEEISKDPQLELDFEDNSYVVHVETNGSLENTEILLAACDVLIEKLSEFRKELGK